jgi:pimeloyl-ACP methyl ester carboxylesterase
MRFVLIHGGFHGAWCWSRTIPELDDLGYQAIATDIPGHGKRVHEEATMAGRLEAVLDVLDVLEPGDVLVGHSGGGLEITRAADAAPELVSHMVYLAAALPLEGRLMQDALVYRDDGGAEGDYDVTGMLEHLRFNDDGSWNLPTWVVRRSSSTMTATTGLPAGPSNISRPRAQETRPPRRSLFHVSGKRTFRAALFFAWRIEHSHGGWPT